MKDRFTREELAAMGPEERAAAEAAITRRLIAQSDERAARDAARMGMTVAQYREVAQ